MDMTFPVTMTPKRWEALAYIRGVLAAGVPGPVADACDEAMQDIFSPFMEERARLDKERADDGPDVVV